MPSSEKITSISKFPKNRMPTKADGKLAITISIALRKTWPYSTRRSVRPLARAVKTNCLLISSRNEFLVSIVNVAKPPTVSAATGSTMCHR